MSVVVSLESFNLFDVVDVMLYFLELWQCFSWNNISQILFQLHSDFNSVQWIKSVIVQCTFSGNTCINTISTVLVSCSEIVLDGFDNVCFDVLFLLQLDLSSVDQLTVLVVCEIWCSTSGRSGFGHLLGESKSWNELNYAWEHLDQLNIIYQMSDLLNFKILT